MSIVTASIFGLFVANMTNVSIPLTGVNYEVNIKSFASHISIKQTYKNVEQTDLECVYGFPINDQAAVVGLTVTIGNRTLISQFKKKDEAFKEYTDALTRGDGAYLLDQSDRSDDTFVLSVGRLPPGKEAIISISYVSTLESVTETKMRLTIPTSLYPRYNPTPLAPKGVAPPEKYLPTVSYKATLSGHIEAIETIANISSPTHPISVTNLGPKEATVKFSGEQEPLDRDLFIDVDLKINPEQDVEVETTADGKYAALFAFVPQFTLDSGFINTEIIFVVDCSGSMDGENKIGDAKRAMQIFLRSIPEGSFFNFYRFGSRFESLFNESKMYSASTFGQAKDYADKTDANLGGTEVLEPLQAIYSIAPRSGFSRQIFLLTDGEVTNTDQVIALVHSNSVNTRLFSFGLGQSPSRSLVNGVAAAGNGKAEFIKHGQELEVIVARQLNRALQPSVTDATLTWNGVKNVQQVPPILPPVFKGDRQLVYALFEIDENAGPGSSYIEFQRGPTKTKVPLTIPNSATKSTEDPFIIKLAARELIKQTENSAHPPLQYGYRGSQQSRAPLPVSDEQIKEKITSLSLSYGVLSKYVSLIAVENRTQEEKGNGTMTMKLREIPIALAETKAPRRYRGGGGWGGSRSGSSSRGGSRSGSGGSRAMAAAMYGCGSRGSSMHRLSSNRYASSAGGSWGSSGSSLAQASFSNGNSFDSRPVSSKLGEAYHYPTTNRPSIDASLSPLSQLLALQQWNGVWLFSPELERATNVTEAEVKAATKTVQGRLADEVVSTMLVISVTEVKYAEKADVWQAIVRKATNYVEKQTDAAALAVLKSALIALVKIK